MTIKANPLTRKLGPLPAWAWLGVLVGAYLVYSHSASASSSGAGGSSTGGTGPLAQPAAPLGESGGGSLDLLSLLQQQASQIDDLLGAVIGTSAAGAGGAGAPPGAASSNGAASSASTAPAEPTTGTEPAPVEPSDPVSVALPAGGSFTAFATPGGGYSLEDPRLPALAAGDSTAATTPGYVDPWMVAYGLAPPSGSQVLPEASHLVSSSPILIPDPLTPSGSGSAQFKAA